MTSAAANEELDAPIDFLHAVSGPMVPEGRKWAEAITALRARVAELEQNNAKVAFVAGENLARAHNAEGQLQQMREYFQHNHEVESNLNARAELAESQLRQVKADAERMMKALDDIYNHNEASRAAVVMYYGVAHPAWLIDRRNDGTA